MNFDEMILHDVKDAWKWIFVVGNRIFLVEFWGNIDDGSWSIIDFMVRNGMCKA